MTLHPPPTQLVFVLRAISARSAHTATHPSHNNNIRLFSTSTTRRGHRRPVPLRQQQQQNFKPLTCLPMPSGRTTRSSSSAAAQGEPEKKPKPAPMEPRPSASVVILSPSNQVLLLHRVSTSSAFPSAHVFPGGNLSAFHDGAVPPPGDAARHADSPAYRLGAIRETFEESGVLLARRGDGALLEVPEDVRERARGDIYENRVRFGEWLGGVGGVADTDNLIPFTRWITPTTQPRRFTTQMYLYMLPLSSSSPTAPAALATPTPDGGLEITAARFDSASSWLAQQRSGSIVLFPPQCVLLDVLARFLTPSSNPQDLAQQRERLREFISEPGAGAHKTARIPWGEKTISPVSLGRARDGRTVLGLEKPGLGELERAGRGGEWERVVLVRWVKGQAREIEIRGRGEMMEEMREVEREREREKAAKL
ncbi:hypothetical protein F4810DRAFT_62462 [Camillea tinctor]|nr:hypothetical protein F4810DRAFT_62462 [Camillea tinctor]